MQGTAQDKEGEAMTDQSHGSRESFSRKLKARSSRSEESAKQASHEKLLLCHGNLEVRFQAIDEASLTTDLQRKIYGEAGGLLTDVGLSFKDREPCDDAEWFNVYKIELLMGQLLGGERLKREIEARLGDTAAQKIIGVERRQSEYEKLNQPPANAEAEADIMRRDFLVRVLESLQWFNRTQYLARPIYIQATKLILGWVLVAMLCVVAPYIALAFYKSEANSSSLWPARLWEIWPLYTVLSIGFLGAFFSRLLFLQRNRNMSLDDVLLQKELYYNILRAGIGTCGALIVYFFLRSGIVSGAIFPDLEKISIQEIKPGGEAAANLIVPILLLPSKDLALLMVWSFLAGFSEALVPTILTRTEEQMSSAATAPKS
jgi:hypothetical protein